MARRDTKNRPPLAPLDVGQYAEWETWTNHRWAWEFLRRNDDFIAACEDVESGRAMAREVARRFRLQRFKDCKDTYETRDARVGKARPAFFSASVSGTRVPVSEVEVQRARREVRQLTIDVGQMVLRFDLSVAIEDDRGLDGQIEAAQKALIAELERLRMSLATAGTDGRNRSTAGRFLELLLVLDLRRLASTNEQRATVLYGEDTNALETFETRRKAARRIARVGYLGLAAGIHKRPDDKENAKAVALLARLNDYERRYQGEG